MNSIVKHKYSFTRVFRIVILLFVICGFDLQAQNYFDEFFLDKSIRIDYFHSGNSNEEFFEIDQIKEEKYWSGSKKNLVSPFNYGKYNYTIIDSSSGKILFSKGFSSLFGEWQTTDEAKKQNKAFEESIIFPYPRKSVKVTISSRDNNNIFKEVFSFFINPENIKIADNEYLGLKTFKVHYSGNHHEKLDIVILPEGYVKDEMRKFRRDTKRFLRYLIKCSPYNSKKDMINVWAVKASSTESGTDIPGDSVWKKTILNTSFSTFGSERYLTTESFHIVKDIAAYVPYDQIFILVNTSKYGGGGIYNFYSVGVSNNLFSAFLMLHEFGHAFAGLGDEYYTSEVAYEGFYSLDSEPWQPNLTTLIDFSRKWESMLSPDIPVPTPREASYRGKIGVFEGGGYVAKGVYSPAMDCTMKSVSRNNFCPVCKASILKMIDWYSE